MIDAIFWSGLGAIIAALLGVIHAHIECWLYNQPRPLSRTAQAVVNARWGFIATILICAWLIDSHRIPYAEPGIWLVLGLGLVLTGLLGWMTRRKG